MRIIIKNISSNLQTLIPKSCEKNSFVYCRKYLLKKFANPKKKDFWKKIILMKKEIFVEMNVDIRILEHKENLTIMNLIM